MNDLVLNTRFITPLIFSVIFVLLMILERLFPLRRRTQGWFGRFLINAMISGLAFLAGTFVVKSASSSLMEWTFEETFGLLYLGHLPIALQVILGFLLMDLTFYYWHRMTHQIALLWRFHRVHHIDPDLDVSTSFRFHFGEIVLSTVFRVLQVGLLGITPFIYIVYELCFQTLTLFHHSNLRLPIGLERMLNKIIVTPRMHGIHHSVIIEQSNSNYSVIFRWWDMLNKTLRLNVPQLEITIGVKDFQQPQANDLWRLLTTPVMPVNIGKSLQFSTSDSNTGVKNRGFMLP